jgi:pimeloyl-ACP methyl ester carboxylesterase
VIVKVTLHGTSMAYADEGGGTPVLLLHAFPLHRGMWAPQVSVLARQCRVVAVDFRGHGESGPAANPWTIDDLATDVKNLLDHLSIPRAVLVGLSMGGYVMFAFYRRYADRVLGLVLADTRAQADTEEGRAGRFAMIQTAESKGAAAVADLMLPKLLSPALQADGDLVRNVRAMIESAPVGTIVGDLRAMADRPDSIPLLQTITHPTLVIVGELDIGTPPSDAQTMARGIRNARLEIIPAAAHLANLEQPDAFNRALLSFLKTIG